MAGPIITVFGITGDLSKRKLLPAFYHLLSENLLPEDIRIIGVSRRPLDIDELLGSVELCVLEKDNVCNPDGIKKLRAALESIQIDPSGESAGDDFQKLNARLQELDGDNPREHLFYMSIPPDAYAPIVKQLGEAGMNTERSRLLLEKPFGYDYDSAEQLITLVSQHFSEEQIYRTDHYLAKETAQNLLTFRLYNPIFSTLWNSQNIKKVHIRAIAEIGIAGRAEFYEQTGALRDLIQSHLLQLLALSLMDLPADLSSDQIHRSKQYFLEQVRPADPAQAVRAQYDTYRQEVNDPSSTTETFVRLHLKHSAERWQDLDIILETGKGLAKKDTSITIEFDTTHEHPSNNLRFQIQPNEGISLDLVVKEPGLNNTMVHKALNFDYETAFKADQHIDAYERVLLDAINGDQSLFASSNEVSATWRIIQPLLDSWKADSNDLKLYPVGELPETVI